MYATKKLLFIFCIGSIALGASGCGLSNQPKADEDLIQNNNQNNTDIEEIDTPSPAHFKPEIVPEIYEENTAQDIAITTDTQEYTILIEEYTVPDMPEAFVGFWTVSEGTADFDAIVFKPTGDVATYRLLTLLSVGTWEYSPDSGLSLMLDIDPRRYPQVTYKPQEIKTFFVHTDDGTFFTLKPMDQKNMDMLLQEQYIGQEGAMYEYIANSLISTWKSTHNELFEGQKPRLLTFTKTEWFMGNEDATEEETMHGTWQLEHINRIRLSSPEQKDAIMSFFFENNEDTLTMTNQDSGSVQVFERLGI